MGLYSIYGYSDEESEKEAKVKISSISSFFLKAKKDHFFTQNRVQKWSFLMKCFKL